LDHPGVVEVPEAVARRLLADFPRDFRVASDAPAQPTAADPERPPIIRYGDAAVVVDVSSGERIVTTLAHAASLANTAEWRLEGPLATKAASAPVPSALNAFTPAARKGRKPVTFEPIGG